MLRPPCVKSNLDTKIYLLLADYDLGVGQIISSHPSIENLRPFRWGAATNFVDALANTGHKIMNLASEEGAFW